MTTSLLMNGRSQAVRLPKEWRLPGKEVSIRKWGCGVLIEPITQTEWPPGYFDSIRISDPAFERPVQARAPTDLGLSSVTLFELPAGIKR